MKKYLLIFILLFTFNIQAQNLIPNGDFELGPDSSAEGWSLWWDITCNNPIPVNGPDFWTIVQGSPDRLLENALFIGCDWDIDTAGSGKAWIDFVWNEAGKTILFAPLHKDSLYRLSYYASWETFRGLATQPTRLEFRFNNVGNTIATNYIHIKQWQFFDTVFVASGNSTELEIWGIENVSGGVKIDNLKLLKNSETDINYIQNNNESIRLYPNPATNKINIEIKGSKNKLCKYYLYNTYGMLALQGFFNATNYCIDISVLKSGIYFLTIKIDETTINKKILITKI